MSDMHVYWINYDLGFTWLSEPLEATLDTVDDLAERRAQVLRDGLLIPVTVRGIYYDARDIAVMREQTIEQDERRQQDDAEGW